MPPVPIRWRWQYWRRTAVAGFGGSPSAAWRTSWFAGQWCPFWFTGPLVVARSDLPMPGLPAGGLRRSAYDDLWWNGRDRPDIRDPLDSRRGCHRACDLAGNAGAGEDGSTLGSDRARACPTPGDAVNVPASVKAAAALFVVYGLAVLLNTTVMQRSGGWSAERAEP